jgi:hypothetical protein
LMSKTFISISNHICVSISEFLNYISIVGVGPRYRSQLSDELDARGSIPRSSSRFFSSP